MRVEARVWRKTQDLVQDAAEALLRERFPDVRSVTRAEVWSFDVDGNDPAAAAGRIREVLEGSTLVVNPNIHRYAMEDGDAGGPGAATPEAGCPTSGCRLLVRVRDRVDPRGGQVLRAIRDHLGRREVTGVQRSVLWSVDLATADAAAAEKTAEEMVGGARGAGILANPHAQDAETRVVKA